MVACKAENNTYPTESPVQFDRAGRPLHVSYRWVIDRDAGYYPNVSRTWITTACNHCEHPACLAACPMSDITKMEDSNNVITKRASDGVVLLNVEKCIGCRYCEAACPYGAPQFNPVTKKVEKCTFCVHRIDQNLLPACVTTCVGDALEMVDAPTPGANAPAGFADPAATKPSVEFK